MSDFGNSPHDIRFNAKGTRAYAAGVSTYRIYDTTNPVAPTTATFQRLLIDCVSGCLSGFSVSDARDTSNSRKASPIFAAMRS